MRAKSKYVFFTILLVIVCCSRDENPLNVPDSEAGYGKLFINTESTSYSWLQDESDDYIFIQGTLENKSNTIFFSRIGAGVFGQAEQEQLVIATNSAGYVEKYNESKSMWNETDLLMYLIEGARFVPIKVSKTYSLYAHLAKESDENERGIYRIGIDYFESENPDSSVSPFQDYSNTFKIE